MELKINIDEKELTKQIERLVESKSKTLIRNIVKEMVHNEVAEVIEKHDIWEYEDEIHKATNEFVLQEIKGEVRRLYYGSWWSLTKAEKDERDAFTRGCATAIAIINENGTSDDAEAIREIVLDSVARNIQQRIGRKVQTDKATREDLAERIAALIEKGDAE